MVNVPIVNWLMSLLWCIARARGQKAHKVDECTHGLKCDGHSNGVHVKLGLPQLAKNVLVNLYVQQSQFSLSNSEIQVKSHIRDLFWFLDVRSLGNLDPSSEFRCCRHTPLASIRQGLRETVHEREN